MPTSPRHDVYGFIHRALRLMLAQLVHQVQTTNWSDPAQAASACAAADRAVVYLDEHAALADAHLAPLVERAAPALRAELDADHAALHVLRHTLREQLAALRDGHGAGVRPRALAVLRALAEAELRHMRREEQQALPRLWEVFADDALVAASTAARAALSPARHLAWLEITIPVMQVAEREQLVAGIGAAPAATRAAVEALLRRHPVVSFLADALTFSVDAA